MRTSIFVCKVFGRPQETTTTNIFIDNCTRRRILIFVTQISECTGRYVVAITPNEKELAAVGISLATDCKPCTDYYVRTARASGASDQNVTSTKVSIKSIMGAVGGCH